MNKVYFISGLGADKRVFSFLDLSFCDPVFIDWIAPLKNESLKSYAIRLRKQIPETHPTVIGISFGGMLVTEMAKAVININAIIISSNKTKKEFPKFLRIGKFLPIYQWLPSPLLKQAALVVRPILGTKGEKQKKVLRQIILDTDKIFAKWAIRSILYWENEEIPTNLIHIHGTSDKLLPYRLVTPDYTIQNGKHLMPMDEYQEISYLLKKLII